MDPGVAWILSHADVEREALLTRLAAAYLPPHRTRLLRVERTLGRSIRARNVTRRYERATGRTTTYPAAPARLIGGSA